jgi:protein required for attachment to host cells
MSKVWVLVADGARARFFEKNGVVFRQIGDEHVSDEVGQDVDIDIRKPGINTRSGPDGPSHLYAPHTDWHEGIKRTFARDLAKLLNDEIRSFDECILIAPPMILGELRKHLNDVTVEKIVHEIAKDLTKSKPEEIKPLVTPPYV